MQTNEGYTKQHSSKTRLPYGQTPKRSKGNKPERTSKDWQ